MSYCYKCGTYLDGEATLCPKCAQQSNTPETVLAKISANYFENQGIRALGGEITLTNKKLMFKPHIIDAMTSGMRGEVLEIPLSFIANVQKCNTLGLLPNGIKVFTQDGKAHQFVIFNRDKIINLINSNRSL